MSLHKQPFEHGEVALVGAGPGDPELLTMRAYDMIKQAEVCVYDRLVSEDIMALLPESCEQVYVGKKQSHHHLSQPDINQLLVSLAKQGKKVVRLKGGDPFVFGRGGEEAKFLLANQVACHIVPGLTAASACTSYAGIPLTHRQVSQSCTLITGHVKESGELDLPWHQLADKKQTVVFYMGVKSLPIIVEQLAKAGRDASTPAALIYKGTTKSQRVYRATMETLPDVVQAQQIKPPTLIVIGEVVDTFYEQQVANLGYLAPSAAK